jgi:hypothetical protein
VAPFPKPRHALPLYMADAANLKGQSAKCNLRILSSRSTIGEPETGKPTKLS